MAQRIRIPFHPDSPHEESHSRSLAAVLGRISPGGGAAWLLTGPVDTPISAIVGGLITGLILGAVQAWAMRADRRLSAAWTIATAVGMAVGLTSGAALVGFFHPELLGDPRRAGRGLRCGSRHRPSRRAAVSPWG